MAKERRRSRTFAVIGLGTFGATIAKELTRFGNHVLGIDKDGAVVNRYADELARTVIADGGNEDVLREIGLGEYDVAVIAIGQDLEASILSALSAKLVGVEHVWAKASSRMHHRILSKIGVERVIHAEAEMGRHAAQMLNNPMVGDYVSLGNGYHVVNVVVPERMAGSVLSEMDLEDRFSLVPLGIMHGSEIKALQGQPCTLSEGDRLILLGKRANLRAFAETI
ncbi:TrkA family potassium uptake protein [Roseicyclus sp. F158]|uniref:TrkA family potassium uptake protein n=1 Tax=Tropicimonas omnivorans TaxID=3075590 RepID=A0ABU3DDW2_9RHOB|nr:TrkA family potassium uptake protein [Roseicyclus sp. F158]MDT0681872.1 TrkA family potassium uptake protein [Roseicyclus sp. F158]